jgi:hypothetical protein
MANNRELSQFGRLVTVVENTYTGIGTTSSLTISMGNIAPIQVNASGVITSTQFVGPITGNLTGNVNSTGVSTFATLNITQSNPTNLNVSGVSTLGNTVVGGATTQLLVNGNARIIGILTIGTSSVTLDGTNNQVNVGTGVTIHHTNGVQVGENTVHSAGLTVNQISVTGVSTFAGIATHTTNLFGTQASFTGVVTALSFRGDGSALTGVIAGTSSQWTTGSTGITTTSNVGIKSTTPSSALDVTGDIKVTGIITATDFNSSSDINLKKNIQVIENPITKLSQLNGVTFTWIENEKASVGVIAQDVEKVLPQLVNDMGSHKVVNYSGLIGLLVECIKHQQRQIDEIKEHLIGD